MLILREQYDSLVETQPRFMETIYQQLKRNWSIVGVRVSGPQTIIDELKSLLN